MKFISSVDKGAHVGFRLVVERVRHGMQEGRRKCVGANWASIHVVVGRHCGDTVFVFSFVKFAGCRSRAYFEIWFPFSAVHYTCWVDDIVAKKFQCWRGGCCKCVTLMRALCFRISWWSIFNSCYALIWRQDTESDAKFCGMRCHNEAD